MGQPAVSKALRRLRETFDDPLFVRGRAASCRRRAPTRSCAPLGRTCSTCGRICSKANISTRPPARGRSCLVYRTSPRWRSCPRSSNVCGCRRRSAPVSTVSLSDAELAEGLEKGEVDAAAGYFPALAQRNFRSRRLSRHGFACLTRAGHPLWRTRMTVAAYLAAEHIVVRREGRSQEMLERFIERRKMRRKVAMNTSNVLSVRSSSWTPTW